MRRLRMLLRAGKHQLSNVLTVLQGRPLSTPPLVATTVDEDDVGLARKLLAERSSWQQAGPVKEFEDAFARWNGSKHAFGFMGGRVALSAILSALGLRPGHEVVLPGYTCVVVLNALRYAGLTPVFCDIELDTYGPDAGSLASRITAKTRAVVMHHLYGLIARDYDAVLALARERGIKVIEDCAHATGAEYRGRKAGNLGHAAFYSAEHSKVFTTVQGGVAVTNDDGIAAGLRAYQAAAPEPDPERIERLLFTLILDYYTFKHPRRWILEDWYDLLYGEKRLISTPPAEVEGQRPAHYGMKMPGPLAAIGLGQLAKIDHYNDLRRHTAKLWDSWCDRTGYAKPLVVKDSVPIYLRYPVLVQPEKKRERSWARRQLGVELGVWFVSNIHPAKGEVPGCPNADRAVAGCVNFPTVGVL